MWTSSLSVVFISNILCSTNQRCRATCVFITLYFIISTVFCIVRRALTKVVTNRPRAWALPNCWTSRWRECRPFVPSSHRGRVRVPWIHHQKMADRMVWLFSLTTCHHRPITSPGLPSLLMDDEWVRPYHSQTIAELTLLLCIYCHFHIIVPFVILGMSGGVRRGPQTRGSTRLPSSAYCISWPRTHTGLNSQQC